jgi:WD40 repeat protein
MLKDEDYPAPPKRPAGFPSFLEALEWSPDGKSLLTQLNGSVEIWLWDPSGKRLSRGERPTIVTGLTPGGARFADGLRLLTATDTRLTVTDLPKKMVIHTLDLGGALKHMASTDGLKVVVTTQGERGRMLAYDLTVRDPKPTELGAVASRIAFSGDGKTLAAVTQDLEQNAVVEIWDASTWKSRLRFAYPKSGDQPSAIRALALSPDGKTLVTGGEDKILRWWDATTGKETHKIGPGWVYYNRAAFRPDGKVLMTVSHENRIRLWDAATAKELPIASGPAWVISDSAFTLDGRRVLSVSERSVFAHDAATGKELWRASDHTNSAVQIVASDDKTAITSNHDGTLLFWDVDTGKVVRKIENPRGSANLLALSPDGGTLAALGSEGDHDRTFLRWDVKTGKALAPVLLPEKSARYAVSSIRYAPDGSGIAIASGTESQVLVFDPQRKEVRQTFGPVDGGINWAAYSADGRTIAAATMGSSIFLWETATGDARLVLKNSGYVTCLAFSPDGRILAVANNGRHSQSTGDKTVEQKDDRMVVRLLDSYTGREFHRFAGHTGSIDHLIWSPDGRRLLSGSHDSTCLIWDVSPALRAKLPSAALADKELAQVIEALGSMKSSDAYTAMAKLTGSPATAVPALARLIRPVPVPDVQKVTGLIRELDSPQFAVRDRASTQLIRIGEGAEGLLRKALKGELSAETRNRIEKVLGELKPSADRLRHGRVLEVLERIGNGAAQKLLAEVAGGADGAWLTREAQAVIARSR